MADEIVGEGPAEEETSVEDSVLSEVTEVEIDHLESALFHARQLDLVGLIRLAAAIAVELQALSLVEERRRVLEEAQQTGRSWRNQMRTPSKGRAKGRGKGFSLSLPHKEEGKGSAPY